MMFSVAALLLVLLSNSISCIAKSGSNAIIPSTRVLGSFTPKSDAILEAGNSIASRRQVLVSDPHALYPIIAE